MTTFGDQVFEFGGAPVGSGRFSSPWATHYFVDYDNGSASNGGKRPDDAMQTITQAVALASGGDVIYIRPRAYQLGQGFRRYVEDVTIGQGGTTGTGNVATNANISLIGVSQRSGWGGDYQGVRWKVSATNGDNLVVRAPGTHIENIGFFNEETGRSIWFQTQTSYVYSGGDGSSVYNCGIKGTGEIYVNGGDGLQIINCQFQAKHDGAVGGIDINGSGADTGSAVGRPMIKDCTFIGGNANNMATGPLKLAGSIYDITVRECYFSGATVDTGDYIVLSGTIDGGVYNCYFASADAKTDLAALVDGSTGLFCAGIHDANGELDMQS